MSAGWGPVPPFMFRNQPSLALVQTSRTGEGLPAVSSTFKFRVMEVTWAQRTTVGRGNFAQPRVSELSARRANSDGSGTVWTRGPYSTVAESVAKRVRLVAEQFAVI